LLISVKNKWDFHGARQARPGKLKFFRRYLFKTDNSGILEEVNIAL